MTVIIPEDPTLPEPDEGPLRIVGYNEATIDSIPGHTQDIEVQFYLSRPLTRTEHWLTRNLERFDDLEQIQGRILHVVFTAAFAATAVERLSSHLAALEKQGVHDDAAYADTIERGSRELGLLDFS